ncbi:MAG: ISKra4 family transposase [Acidimicrobiales bacterium]
MRKRASLEVPRRTAYPVGPALPSRGPRPGRRRRGDRVRERGARPWPPALDGRGHRGREPPRLPSPRSLQSAPRRRSVEPADRAALSRPTPAGCDRVDPRILRRGERGHRAIDWGSGRQAPGGVPHRRGRDRRRGLLRRKSPRARREHRGDGGLRRWQGDRHEARRAARSDRQGRLRCDPQARDPPVQGEKRYRKRMAEVGAVYDLCPVPRSAADVLASKHDDGVSAPPAPKATGKWVTASVADDAAEVVTRVFDEAERRDPRHKRTWVALVDGNNHQIDRINAEAENRELKVTVLVDLIHVMEYIWSAAWCFFAQGDQAAEEWVRAKTLAVLEGNARDVAAGIRRRASTAHLAKAKRKNADACATYLTNKAPYLDYPTALAAGWPVATGIIEGTCRYLVADRMDITGARWSVAGAEAVLKLRAVRSNGDFDEYWTFHLDRERQRVHESRYVNGVIPLAA